MSAELISIHLHGDLGERFGKLHRMAVSSPTEAVRAISVQRPGFRKAITEGNWKIIRGDAVVLGEDQITMLLGSNSLHIIPVAIGSGLTEDIELIVGGVALAAAAFFFAPAIPVVGAFLASAGVGIGISLVSSGVSALVSPKPPAANDKAGVDQRTSFIFQGAENVSVQGICVPLVFGRFLVGSNVISAGLSAEAIAA